MHNLLMCVCRWVKYFKIRRLALKQLSWTGKLAYFKTSPKKLNPEDLVFVYLDTLAFFFDVDLKIRGNF